MDYLPNKISHYMSADKNGGNQSGQASTTVKKCKKTIKYLKIKDIIIGRIIAGIYPAGSYLPSESLLVKEFDVSRVTIRQALNILQKMDMVASRQGKGHYVRNIQARQDLSRLQGFGEIMAPLGVVAHSKLLKVEQIKAPNKVAEVLKLERSDQVIKTIRLRMAADIVMSIDESYFPLEIGEPLINLDLENNDVFHLIETNLDIEINYADILMDMIIPSDFIRHHLGTSEQDHVLRIERITYDQNFRPIDFEYIYGQPETHQFKLRVPRW